jgi:hypothetical protein
MVALALWAVLQLSANGARGVLVIGSAAAADDTEGAGEPASGGTARQASPELRTALTEGGLIEDPDLWGEIGRLFGYIDPLEMDSLTLHKGWCEAGRAMVPLRCLLEFRWSCTPTPAVISVVPWKNRPCVRVSGIRDEAWYLPLDSSRAAIRVADGVAEEVALPIPPRERDGTLFVPLRLLIDHFGLAAGLVDANGEAWLIVVRLEPGGSIYGGWCPMRAESKAPPPPKEPNLGEARSTIIKWLNACKTHDWDVVDRLTIPGGNYYRDLVSYSLLGRRKGDGWYAQEIRATWRGGLGLAATSADWIEATWDADAEEWRVTLKE